MSGELRRSFKEKAKEKLAFSFRLSRRSNTEISERTPSLDESLPPGSAPPRLLATDLKTESSDPIQAERINNTTMTLEGLKTTRNVMERSSSTDGPKEKRRSRHIVQPKGTITYEVTGRDTLASIAAQFDTTTSELKKLNKLMTTMVFPGQVIYRPDIDYIPSEGSTPTSPTCTGAPMSLSPPTKPVTPPANAATPPANGTTSPTYTGKPAFDLKLIVRSKGPGLAERQKSVESPHSQHIAPPDEDEVQRLDEECTERFIKVSVKHITDGQGVVNGVLLVTPNAIMFDPNTSDPLVVDRGAEEYGMIAPMDTVISAAMYHDIAAMNKHKRSKGADGEEPVEVYHDTECPLYKQRVSPNPESQDPPDNQTRSPANDFTCERLRSSDSVCSCGVMDKSADVRDRLGSSPLATGGTRVVRANSSNQATVGFYDDATDGGIEIKTDASGADSGSGGSTEVVMTTDGSGMMDTQESGHTAVVGDDLTTPHTSISAHLPAEAHLDLLSPAAAAGEEAPVAPPSGAEGKCSDDVNRARAPSPTSIAAYMHMAGNSFFSRDRSPEGGLSFRSPSPHGREDLSIPRDSCASPRPSLSPKDQGLLSRTLESLSSLGSSFPGSPNITSLATGLFSWNQDGQTEPGLTPASVLLRDKSQEENDVFMESDQADGAGTDRRSKSHPLGDDFEIENIVKLSDKPDMFKDISGGSRRKKELIPRPATHYEDPPLYLCLRIGLPNNKRISKTCPIESYMKQKHKPEYWFCIPRDKVDQLYAFFLQWSPSIYGSEDEVNAKDRGFIVINDSEEDDGDGDGDGDDIDIIDDHFDKMADKAKRMTRDWEIVNLEEARRRLSCAEVENLPLPELSEPSVILDHTHMRRLCVHLPARAEGYPWSLIYSSEKNGFSLKTLYRTMHKIDCPILIAVKDTSHQVFGAMLPCAVVLSDHFYGTGESFLFTFYDGFQRFGWSGGNNFFIKGNADSLSIGAGNGLFGLWLDGDLYHGRTHACETYNNELLTESEDFTVKALEAWGFI